MQVQDSNRIVCPCHGSEFAVSDGSVVHGPAESPLASYPVQEKGGKIFVTHTSKDSLNRRLRTYAQQNLHTARPAHSKAPPITIDGRGFVLSYGARCY